MRVTSCEASGRLLDSKTYCPSNSVDGISRCLHGKAEIPSSVAQSASERVVLEAADRFLRVDQGFDAICKGHRFI